MSWRPDSSSEHLHVVRCVAPVLLYGHWASFLMARGWGSSACGLVEARAAQCWNRHAAAWRGVRPILTYIETKRCFIRSTPTVLRCPIVHHSCSCVGQRRKRIHKAHTELRCLSIHYKMGRATAKRIFEPHCNATLVLPVPEQSNPSASRPRFKYLHALRNQFRARAS